MKLQLLSKVKNIALGVLLILTFVSCSKDEVTEVDTWQEDNERVLKDLAQNQEYRELNALSNRGKMYYKILTQGTGTKEIYFNSGVQLYYKAWYALDNTKYNITAGKTVARWTFDDGTPLSYPVNTQALRDGIATALQYMKEGDKWELWMPYTLTLSQIEVYNNSVRITPVPEFNVLEYSTIVLELEVVKVYGIDEY